MSVAWQVNLKICFAVSQSLLRMPDKIGGATPFGFVGQDLKRLHRTKSKKELNTSDRRLSVELRSPDALRREQSSTPVGSSVTLFPAQDAKMQAPNNAHLKFQHPHKKKRTGWGGANVRFIPKKEESPRLDEVPARN